VKIWQLAKAAMKSSRLGLSLTRIFVARAREQRKKSVRISPYRTAVRRGHKMCQAVKM